MNPLEFANPINWWWATLAIPIVLLYILKIRLRRQPVSTLLFWDQLFDEKKPRAWWQRLRHLLSLVLQLAFLLLVVAALTDPLWSWQRNRQRRIVLVVDNSASMQAVEEDGQSRLDKAKRSAAGLVRSLRSGDRMAVLSAGGRTQVAIGMTDHQRSLLEAIDKLPPIDGPTDVAAAVTAGERLLTDEQQPGEILVITDGCFEQLADVQARKRVKVYGVATARDNVAITRYQVRRSLIDAVGYQILVDITNFSKEKRACRVELNLAGELVDVVPLEIEPGATVTRILDHVSAGGGELVAKLDAEDALSTDNVAVAVLPKRAPIPVVLASKGNVFLQGVLAAIPLVELQIVAEAPSIAPPDGILVLDRMSPKQLPTGRVVVVDPQESCDAWSLGDAIAQPIVAKVEADSPLTRHVRLDNVLFPGARLLKFAAEAEALIRDPLDQPLLARLRRPGGDAVVLTCNLEKGDLPLRIAFPVLMKNTFEYFQGNSGELRPAVATGQVISLDVLPAAESGVPETQDTSSAAGADADSEIAVVEAATTDATEQIVLVSPHHETVPLAAADGRVTIGPLLEMGLWTVRPATRAGPKAGSPSDESSFDDPRVVRVACNLVDAAESDLRPRGELPEVEGQALVSLGGQSMWFYLTLVATGLMATEWWLYQRRIVG
jgi:hypothetical protein